MGTEAPPVAVLDAARARWGSNALLASTIVWSVGDSKNPPHAVLVYEVGSQSAHAMSVVGTGASWEDAFTAADHAMAMPGRMLARTQRRG